MTLRELLQSVDAEAYASVPLFEELLKTKPEYGSSNRIKVKVLNGEIAVSHWVTSWLALSMWLQTFRLRKCSCWMRFSKKCPMRDSQRRTLMTSGMT